MTKSNKTRSALFTSIISLLLCVSMLVGTTFAWFTDTAASGMNQIIAGNLDVELLYKNGNNYENAKDVKLFDDIKLWEPGMVVYETVKIANVGNLALKYAIKINTGNENTLNGHGLSEVLHFAVVEGEISKDITRTEALALAEASTDKGMLTSYTFNNNFSLDAETESKPMTLIVYWPENGELDNQYNANNGQKTSDGAALHIDLGLTVYASQETVEEDSFDKYYDDAASYPQNMWLGDVAEALMIDEETKTISISSGAELAKFGQDAAKYEGYTVVLTDSIDLGNIAWTPIALKSITFDGNGKTIYNLNATDPVSAGLFGYASTSTVKDLHVVNAVVASNHYAAAIAGHGLCAKIEGCSVENAVITTSAEQVEGNWDNGDKAGGIVGYLSAEPTAYVKNCSVTNAKITGYRDIGGVVGYANSGAEITGNTVTDVNIVCDAVHNYKDYKTSDEFDIGEIVGEGTADESNTPNEVKISYVVASEAALKSAFEQGREITLAADIALTTDTKITVANGKEVVLDLNGHTLSGENTETETHNFLIDVNGGTLTVKGGTVTLKHTGTNMNWNGAATVFDVTAGGVLNIVDATVENLGGTDMNFGVHLNNWGEVTLNVENSTIKATYCAVRVFNSGPDMNNVTIKNSTIYSEGSSAFWVHNYTSADFGSKLYSGSKEAYDESKVVARLNFNILENGNTYVAETNTNGGFIRYGFNDAIQYDANGNVAYGVTVSGIAGFEGKVFGSTQAAYNAISPKVAELAGLEQKTCSADAFKALYTDDGMITWTIYGKQTVESERLFTFGRQSAYYGDSWLTGVKVVGGNASAGLVLNKNVMLPYDWWPEETSISATFESLTITAGAGLGNIQTYQAGNDGKTYGDNLTVAYKNCTINGGFYSYWDKVLNLTFDGCTFNAPANTQYAMMIQGNGIGTVTVNNCNFYGYTRGVNFQKQNTDFVFTNNTIESTVQEADRGAIQLTDGKSFIVTGNTVNVNGGNAFWFHSAAKNENVTYTISNNNISAPYLANDDTSFGVNNKITSSGNTFNYTSVKYCMEKDATEATASTVTAIK